MRRSCYAADRTGHMILQTMYQQSIKNQVRFFNEYMMLDLLMIDGAASGVVALCLRDGDDPHLPRQRRWCWRPAATGAPGASPATRSPARATAWRWPIAAASRSKIWRCTSSIPPGLYKIGILLSEAARGEGAYLRNSDGRALLVRYAPTMQELAPRDMVSRFIVQEIDEGRGIDGKDYVYLSVTHLGKEVIDAKLPDITDFARNYLGVEPYYEPVPIQPTAHYAMGGIPTDIEGRVVMDEHNTVVPGLYAAGEVACVSVHGANRLGTNSLVDLIVFGRRAGKHIAALAARRPISSRCPTIPTRMPREMVERSARRATRGESADHIRNGTARRDDG